MPQAQGEVWGHSSFQFLQFSWIGLKTQSQEKLNCLSSCNIESSIHVAWSKEIGTVKLSSLAVNTVFIISDAVRNKIISVTWNRNYDSSKEKRYLALALLYSQAPLSSYFIVFVCDCSSSLKKGCFEFI